MGILGRRGRFAKLGAMWPFASRTGGSKNGGTLLAVITTIIVYTVLQRLFETPCLEGVEVDPEINVRYRASTEMAADNVLKLASEKKHQRAKTDDVTKIIIHGAFRTGSTFTSDFFLKNNDIYYMYEPFFLVPFSDVAARLLDLFRDLFDCKFQRTWGIAEANPKFRDGKGRNLLHSWRQRLFCWKYAEDMKCSQRPLKAIAGDCQSYNTRVIKSIRINEVEQVHPLMVEGYKVVQLIRDPRGILNSRATMGKINYNKVNEDMLMFMYNDARIYCTNIAQDIRYVTKMFEQNVTSFTDNYYIARYEDLAARPRDMMENLYEFIDIEPDEQLLDWIDETEDGISGRGHSATNKKEHKLLTYRRNATATSMNWRTQMTMPVVRVVQNACGDVMRKLGYVFVNDEHELRDLSRSLNLPFNT